MTAFAFPITVGHTTSPTVNVFEPTVGAFGKMGSAPPEHAATGVDMKNPGPQARSLKPYIDESVNDDIDTSVTLIPVGPKP